MNLQTQIAELILCAARNAKPKEWTTWDVYRGAVTNRETPAAAENLAAANVIEKIWPRDATGKLMPIADQSMIAGETH